MIQVCAPAKVNLSLFVNPFVRDSLHEIASLMVKIPLYDVLTFKPSNELEVVMHGFEISLEHNLVYRAVKAFEELTGKQIKLRIDVFKRIPVGAGLGGGSSDAAAVLRTLTKLSGVYDKNVREIARSLGSDVSFFMTPHHAVVLGQGEVVRPVPFYNPPPFIVVLPKEGESLSTQMVYQEFDRKNNWSYSFELICNTIRDNEFYSTTTDEPLTNGDSDAKLHSCFVKLKAYFENWAEVLGKRAFCKRFFYNDLGPIVEAKCPHLALIEALIEEMGGLRVFVSGAGPTLIGIFDDPVRAIRAACRVRQMFGNRVLMIRNGVCYGRLCD